MENEKLAECTKGFKHVMRAYTVNYYGGCFQYDDSTKTRVVWVPKLLRRLVFWRWPTEVRWGLLKGFNPGFGFADIEPLDPGGNYASSAEDTEIERLEVKNGRVRRRTWEYTPESRTRAGDILPVPGASCRHSSVTRRQWRTDLPWWSWRSCGSW